MSARPNHESLPRRDSSNTDGASGRVLSKLEASGQLLTIHQLLGNSPNGFRPFMQLSDALFTKAVLPADVREIVILWMAHERGVPYEWTEHVPMATRAGVDDAQVAALASGSTDADTFPPEALLALDAARQLLAREGISTEVWEGLTARWGVEGALDLVFTVGWWGGFVPTAIEALGLVAADVDGR